MAIIGQDSGSYTPQDVERKRRLAEMLMKGSQQAREPFGALAQGLRGALSGWNEYEADQAEASGRKTIAELLQKGDYQGVLGSDWASPNQSAMASMLQGREWNQQDQQANWAREDSRFNQQQALEREKMSQPDWGFENINGDIIAFNKRDPSAGTQTVFDGPDQATGFRPMTAEEKAAAGLPPDLPAQVGPDGKIDVIGGSGVKVDVNNMGNIPAGYKVDYDAQGNPVSMSPVPGSPAAAEAAAAADKALLADQNQNQGANIVVEDVGRAIDLIKKDPKFTTGIFGKMLSGVGGTNANSVSELVRTIKANSAFDQLQAMRAASPTGGALGAVSDTEMGLLTSAIGSLEQSQNDEQLVYNLERVQRIYNEVVNGPGAELPSTPDYKGKYGLE
jgi:hypothetical protein